MKIAVMQASPLPGDSAGNLSKIDQQAALAAKAGARLLLASELAIPGYGAGDN